jgi:hypothetical protein
MKRHSTDPVSLAFGLIFAGIAGWWLIGRYILDVHVNIPNLGLIMAAALIVLGLLGVVGSLRRESKPHDVAVDEAVADPPASDPDTTDTALIDPYPAEPVGPDTAELPHPFPPSEHDDRPI